MYIVIYLLDQSDFTPSEQFSDYLLRLRENNKQVIISTDDDK